MLFRTSPSLGPFFLRLSFAFFIFYHAVQNVFGIWGGEGWNKTMTLMTSSGVDGLGLPGFLALGILLTEIVLPAFLVVGFFVRPAALAIVGISITMLVVFYTRLPLPALEYPCFVLMAALSLCFSGAGAYSLDRAIASFFTPSSSGTAFNFSSL